MAAMFSQEVESIKSFGAEMLGECLLAAASVLTAFFFCLWLHWMIPVVMLGLIPIC